MSSCALSRRCELPAPRAAADFGGLLQALAGGAVEFIVVGGVAGVAHGLARATYDLDVVYARSPANLDRLVSTLAPLSPLIHVKRVAGRPKDLEAVAELEALREERDKLDR